MVKKSSLKSPPLSNNTNIPLFILGVIGYIIGGLIFYAGLGIGAVIAIMGIAKAEGTSTTTIFVGLAVLIGTIGLNLIITRLLTGKWRVSFPNFGPYAF